jgi:hypothetical protein
VGKGSSVPTPSIKSFNNDFKGVGYAKNKKNRLLACSISPTHSYDISITKNLPLLVVSCLREAFRQAFNSSFIACSASTTKP